MKVALPLLHLPESYNGLTLALLQEVKRRLPTPEMVGQHPFGANNICNYVRYSNLDLELVKGNEFEAASAACEIRVRISKALSPYHFLASWVLGQRFGFYLTPVILQQLRHAWIDYAMGSVGIKNAAMVGRAEVEIQE